MRHLLVAPLLVALIILALGAEPAAQSAEPFAGGEVIAGRYIVVLEAGSDPYTTAAEFGLSPRTYYTQALNGFSVEMTGERAQTIADDSSVTLVEPVRRVRTALHENAFQTLTEGVNRIDADENPEADIGLPGADVDADIAIIDSGIDLDHPDLNAMPGFAAYEELLGEDENGEPLYGPCDSGRDPQDGNGHGTHVAGIAAAIDNKIGVVGVAPGARVWSVRILRDDGFGCTDDVLHGIDWVTGRKIEYNDGAEDGDPGIDFTAANMSLTTQPNVALCSAIANSVAQGVVFVVASGNAAVDASFFGPANCDSVIAVSAYADYDGKPGGIGGRVCRWTGELQFAPDDALSLFSDSGPVIDAAAPGVCIMSTYLSDDPRGGYAVMNGTSMAAPHVTGAVALYEASFGYDGPYDGPSVMKELRTAGWTRPRDSACGFINDADVYPEPVLYIGTSCPAPPPPPSPDIDCDEIVTGHDPLILVRYAAEASSSLPEGCPPVGVLVTAAAQAHIRGDMNCDGAVNVADALVIMKLLGGVIAEVEPCPG